MSENSAGDGISKKRITRRTFVFGGAKLVGAAALGAGANAVTAAFHTETAYAPTIADVLKTNAAEGRRYLFLADGE